MAAILQRSQATLLKHLPSELLRIIADICADDFAVSRATLLSLSVMNKYLRNVTNPRLFQRIRFRDSPDSRGDEIVHSIRRFMAAPEFWCHVRTVSLYLNRLKWLEIPRIISTQLYHYLVLPELIDALVKMPGATELFILVDGVQENMNFGDTYFENGFLRAFPQLETFYYEGAGLCPTQMTLLPEGRFDPTTASNLTRLRVYKTCSDPRTDFELSGWRVNEISRLKLYKITPELEYLSVLGELNNFPVSVLFLQLKKIPKLKYLDIADEQMMDGYLGRQEFRQSVAFPSHPGDRLPYIKYLASNHPQNENRSEVARNAFYQCVKLRRICFVRSCMGEVYLRCYPDTVANSTGYVSPDIKGADLIDIPERWHHGVPQTGLLGFTPWQGIENEN